METYWVWEYGPFEKNPKRQDSLNPETTLEVIKAADAQATIAALQARVQELEKNRDKPIEQVDPRYWDVNELRANVELKARHIDEIQAQLTQRTAECDALKLVNDTHMKTVMKLSHVVEQRTAELEAAQRERDESAKDRDDWITSWRVLQRHNERIEAELERVRDQFADLRKMVAALPEVEGAVVVSNGYVKDSTRCHALFGADEDAALYAALLQHRQGMEG